MRCIFNVVIGLFLVLVNAQTQVLHFTSNNGLPHDITYGIFEDNKGYIWIGTDKGVVKYNGQKFRTFSSLDGLENNYIIDITQLEDNSMLLATWGKGIQRIRNDTVMQFSSESMTKLKIHELVNHNGIIYSHAYLHGLKIGIDENNASYFYEYSYISEENTLDSLSLQPHLSGEILSYGYSTIGNNLFIHNRDVRSRPDNNPKELKGVYLEKDDKLIPCFSFLRDEVVYSLTKFGSKYIAGLQGEIIIFNEDGVIKRISLRVEKRHIIKVVPLNSKALVLLSQDRKGLKFAHRLDLENNCFFNFSEVLSTQATFSDILLDFENNLWLSTYGDGVYMIKHQNFKVDNTLNKLGSRSSVIDIVFVQDKAYLLTEDVLHQIEIKSKKRFSMPLSGWGKSLTVLQNDSLIVCSTKIKDSVIEHLLFKERFGRFIHQFENETVSDGITNGIQFSSGALIEKDFIAVYDVEKFNNDYLVATNVGCGKIDFKKNNIDFSAFENILPKLHYKDILIDNNDLWFASDNDGVFKILKNKTIQYTTKDGLLDNNINCLNKDSNGRIWIGSQSGATVYSKDKFYSISKESGLNSSYISAIAEDNEGNIWLGGNEGIDILENSEPLLKNMPPKINISQNNVQFDYQVISYNQSSALRTEYRINQQPWIIGSSAQKIDFSEYKDGDYSFQLRAKKLDSDWVISQPYHFSIESPWYKTFWGMFLTSGFILSLIIAISTILIKKGKRKSIALANALEKQNKLEGELTKVRDNIARDFHDDLGNRLAQISLNARILSMSKNTIGNQKRILEKVSEDATYLYKGTKDFIFSLKAESNYLEEVISYLVDFGEDCYKRMKIVFKVEKEVDSDCKMPYYWSRHLIYIFKEAMVNVAKHSNGDGVVLSFYKKGEELLISLNDNGKKFDKHHNSPNKNGIKNMEYRASRIGGELVVRHYDEKGTVVQFKGLLIKKPMTKSNDKWQQELQ